MKQQATWSEIPEYRSFSNNCFL